MHKHISKAEIQLHCKRKTRGEEETISLIQQLIESFDGVRGHDSLGVPLIDSPRMAEIWRQQKRHAKCIQDPPGFQMYTKTGTLVKGGVVLNTYRCARGSTSLESYHLHLNRFIPGSYNLQFYILK